LVLDAITNTNIPHLLTVIVPRHPQRFDEVATLLDKRGFKYVRRSALSDNFRVNQGVAYVLGDSMGEMFTYYAACDVAFIAAVYYR